MGQSTSGLRRQALATAEEIELRPLSGVYSSPEEKTLLLLSDDTALCHRLLRAFDALGFVTTIFSSLEEASDFVRVSPPAFALLELRLKDGSGLTLLKTLYAKRSDVRIVMLTAYGSIVTAVAAIRAGAVVYLLKPADDADIIRVLFGAPRADEAPPLKRPISANSVRWEHIFQVYDLFDHNISETARRLSMQRRTLQRILTKHAPLWRGSAAKSPSCATWQ